MKRRVHVVLAAVVLAAAAPLDAQPLFETPRVSPAASVTQRVGITDITVTYHRPSVQNRDIWGALVPYDPVWRGGANENTTISFTHPVYIADTRIDAGTYGLHVLPAEDEWTFILSNQSEAWGSYTYDEAEDAVRVSAVPVDIPHQEYLTYTFQNPTRNETALALSWEMKQASFDIWVDTDEIVVANLRDGLRGVSRFSWRGWQQAASWCLHNDTHLDQAMEWIDQSIRMEPNFSNLSVKAGLLAKQGKEKESEEILAGAMDTATEAELNRYGYQLMARGETDQAIAAFRTNADGHPDSWNVYDSLAEAYVKKGDTRNAIRYYEKALALVEDDTEKDRIRGQLAQLESSGRPTNRENAP